MTRAGPTGGERRGEMHERGNEANGPVEFCAIYRSAPMSVSSNKETAWFYKALVVGLAPVLLEHFFPGRGHFTFAAGSIGGVTLQHFLPPRGRTIHLFILLALAVACAMINWWFF